jgi:hypothetical protein
MLTSAAVMAPTRVGRRREREAILVMDTATVTTAMSRMAVPSQGPHTIMLVRPSNPRRTATATTGVAYHGALVPLMRSFIRCPPR